MSGENENLDPCDVGEEHEQEPPRKKRNCGRTGATSVAGRRRSAMNALKHGSCSGTHLLNNESEDEWLLVLHQWRESYAPPAAQGPCPNATDENPAEPPAFSDCHCPTCAFNRSTLYLMVLKTAEAEWHRRRSQRNLNVFLYTMGSVSLFNWTPEQIKTHDLYRRYKTADERTFQREFRQLETYFRNHKPEPAPPSEPESAPEPTNRLVVITPDENSPTGYSCREEHPPREGVVYPYPVPRPPNFPGAGPSSPRSPLKDDSETG